MPSLKSIMKPSVPVDVPFGAEKIRVYYRPQYLTPAIEEQFRKLNREEKENLNASEKDAREAETSEAFRGIVIELVESWDLKYEDDDPETIPLTLEGIKRVPYDILGDILSAVMDASLPNPETGPNSEDGLPPEDTSGPVQTGTPSSVPPGTSASLPGS